MLPKVKQPVCIDCPFQGYCFTEETSKGSLRWQVAIPDLLEPAVGSSCTAQRGRPILGRGGISAWQRYAHASHMPALLLEVKYTHAHKCYSI